MHFTKFLIFLVVFLVIVSKYSASIAQDAPCKILVNPSSGPPPLEVELRVSISDEIPQPWSLGVWNFGDGNQQPAFLPIIRHSYNDEGTYHPTYRFSDGLGSEHECNAEVRIFRQKELNLKLNADPPEGFAPLRITISVNATNGTEPITFSYQFGDGSAPISSSNSTITHTFLETGNYTISVEAQDNEGTRGANALTIKVSPASKAPQEVSRVLDQAVSALMAEDLTISSILQIIDSASRQLDRLLTQAANVKDEVKQQIATSARRGLKTILERQVERLAQLIQKPENVTLSSVKSLAQSSGKLSQTMIDHNIPLTIDIVNEAGVVEGQLLLAGIDDIAREKGVSLGEIKELAQHPETTQEFFKNHPVFLKTVIKETGIPVVALHRIPSNKIKNKLDSLGLSSELTNKIESSLEESLDAGKGLFIDEKGTIKSASQLVGENMGLEPKKLSVDPITGIINAQLDNHKGLVMGLIDVNIMTPLVPVGVLNLPDDTKINVSNNFAMHIAPSPYDPIQLAAEFASLGLNANFTRDGRIVVHDNNGKSYSTFVGWHTIKENNFSTGLVSFDIPQPDITSQAFSILVRYADGTVQSLPPAFVAFESLIELLEEFFPGQYSIDRDTGLIDLRAADAGLWRPDYSFTPIEDFSKDELDWYQQNKIKDGLAFKIQDQNEDGWNDVIFYSSSPAGKQTLFFVPN
ncbi:Cell surface protein [Dissulfuribacter thermophilus]|uniref:Cell surface protein n=1 Tax=Dissulfuribacter thermophilus TaxID=1156395 RepID=A0A1B9F5E1_9BACT|nr:PKD domain-containing protein [Dissulfuribacter thermophilus]OCC15168.1 Cell surface protein [Dissulfuribacter thermophilus]